MDVELAFSERRIALNRQRYDAVNAINLSNRASDLSFLDGAEKPVVGSVNFNSIPRSPIRLPPESPPSQKRSLSSSSSSDELPPNRPPPAPRPYQRISKLEALRAITAYAENKFDRERAKKLPPIVTEYLAPTFYRKIVPAGLTLLRRVEKLLFSMFPGGLFLFQKKLADEAFRASLRQLLDTQFENLWEYVCKKRGWPDAPRNLFTVASRRSGKTSLLAAFCATNLISVRRMTIIVYSVALRTAQEFVRLVQRYILMTPEGRAMLTSPGGSERLAMNGPEPGDERWIRSFPSGGQAQNVSDFFFLLFFFSVLGGPISLQVVAVFVLDIEGMGDAMDVQPTAGLEVETCAIGDADVTLHNPTDEMRSRVSWEIKQQLELCKQLEANLATCRISEITFHFDRFVFSMQKLIAEHGRLLTEGYAGVHAIPLVLGAMTRLMQTQLPNECRFSEDQNNDLFANILRQFDQNYRGSPINVLFHAEFLSPESEQLRTATILDPRQEEWIRHHAEIGVQFASDVLRSDLGPDQIRQVSNTLEHLKRIKNGQYPYGFNTEREHRYVLIDLELLLEPDCPNILADGVLTPENAAYIQRIAQQRLSLEGCPEQYFQHLKRIVDGQFPHGYRVAEAQQNRMEEF